MAADGAEGLERIEALEDAVEVAKRVRKSPLTRARPRVPAKTRLTYLERRARASDPPRKRRARALATSATTSNVSSRFADIASPQAK